MTPLPESDIRTRWMVYGLIITLAVGLTAGRIASVERLHEPSVHKVAGSDVPRPGWPATRPDPSPTFSSNDRSRWAAARALVEKGTFIVGQRTYHGEGKTPRYTDEGIIFEEGFQSVDKVLKPDTLEFFSTKPPLLTLMMAGEYWVMKNALGWTMAIEPEASAEEKTRVIENRFHVTRVALVTFNLIPFVIYLVLLAWLAERFGVSEWARYFIVAAGAFATLVSPFLVTINNHTLAATSTAIVLYAVVRIREGGDTWGMFLLGGFAAGFTACLELPALSLAVGVFVFLAWHHPRQIALFVIAALIPAIISLGANYVQLGQLKPAYAEFGGPWYEYEGSHWVPPGVFKRGIDFARRNGETRATYAFHLLIGHHGIFSLTPVMLLAVVGMLMGVWRLVRTPPPNPLPEARGSQTTPPPNPLPEAERGRQAVHPFRVTSTHPTPLSPPSPLRGGGLGGWGDLSALLALFTLLVSVVVVGFYLFKSDNYGGWSNGPRWLMWLSPMWLVAMLPILDVLAKSRWGRLFALVLLALSIVSMSYQNWNPWRHPWLYNWMESRGWIDY